MSTTPMLGSRRYLHFVISQDPESIFPLFRISYHWIAPLGLLATLIVGATVGWLFDKRTSLMVDLELFTPAIWRYMPQEYHDKSGETRRLIAAKELRRSGQQYAGDPLIKTKSEAKVNNVEVCYVPDGNEWRNSIKIFLDFF